MSQRIHPLLLCGGSGTRLWPLSRKSHPKQFVELTGKGSLFQASVQRVEGPDFADPVLVTGSDFRFVVLEQMAAVQRVPSAILIEPSPRNTAPAVLAGALQVSQSDPDGLILVVPSDHVIPDTDAFRAAVLAAAPSARAGQILTFGIKPDRAETGYGWLELSELSDNARSDGPRPLKRFVEKPDQAVAEQMLADGRFLWNAGIFLFSATTLISAVKAYAPKLFSSVSQALEAAKHDLAFIRLDAEVWDSLENISIDCAVMERADNLSVMPFEGMWSDLGGWDAVWREAGPDENGVVTTGPATALWCENSLLRAEDGRQEVVGIGLKDTIVIAMPDAVLVAHKDKAQDVKQAVAALKAKGASQATTLPRDYRPWGWFESLVVGGRFQVKRIVVNPGASLSLQSHHHRSEHWIVVEGTAKVTIGEDVKLVTENQSVYIPLGAVHRMENPGKLPMVLIEVQTGSYLGEDDIVRYKDAYSRGQGSKG